jgi:hypothetical protein
LNLTFIPPATGIDIVTACESFTWIDGVTYTASNNTASDTVTTTLGCDSIVTLNLTIHQPSSGVDVIYSCDPIMWIDGVTYTASNNTATDTLTNALGCDSVVTLNLTILNATAGTDQILACDDYTWIDGVTYTNSNNSATFTLANLQGCDSVVTLDLTIHQVNVSTLVSEPTITANAAQASYRWLDCNNSYAIIPGQTAQVFTATANGSYAVEVTELGCVDTSACVNITTIGSEEFENPKTVRVFPNPTSQFLHVEQLLPGIEKRVSLVNLLGQEMMVLHTTATAIELDVQGIAPNVYILQVVSERGLFTQKIYVSTQ